GPVLLARAADARTRAKPPDLPPDAPAPGSLPAPFRLQSTGWRPVRGAVTSGAPHLQAASIAPGSRSAAARGRITPIEMWFGPAAAANRFADPIPQIPCKGLRGRR